MSDQEERRIKIACPGCGQKLDMTGLVPFSHINCPSCNSQLTVPKWFDSYLLESPEGVGGMATVYRALDIALDRDVAIKVFDPRLVRDGISPELFLQAARVAATINHPAVVPIYSCGELDGSAYIVMQYMSGGTLGNQLRNANGRLPMMETCRWIRDICEGLDAARELGIVHHDVKPANILLDIDSNAKITDFGLAQAVSGKSASAFLDPAKMWLSPHYVSPEKVLTGEEGSEGDVYSLGASFYHLLSGQPPFQSDNVQELVYMRTTRDPVSPDRIRPDITPALASVILDMMNRNPAARPTYAQVVARINDAVRAIMRPAAAPVPETVPPPPEQPAPPKSVRKVFSIPADRTGKPRHFFRSSHLTLLLILLFLMCGLCFLVFLPRFVDKRTLLDAAPSLKAIYGDVPLESFPFLTDHFYESPIMAANFAFSDSDAPIETRCVAGWVSGMNALLGDVPSAVTDISDMGEELRSAASLAGTRVPRADNFCLTVLSRPDIEPPDVYFSQEQHVRVLLGRLVRSLYDLDADSIENGRIPDRILERFGELRNAFRTLPGNSWLVKLYDPRLHDWESVLSGKAVQSADLEPLFLRLRPGSKKDRRQNNLPGSGSTISTSPFGVESPILPSGD